MESPTSPRRVCVCRCISDRQASLENRIEALERSTKEQIAGVLQAAHVFRNNNIEDRLSIVVTQLASANDQLASLKIRMGALARAVETDQSFYNNRQASLENRVEAFEKSTKEQIAGVLQAGQLAARDLASANDRLASIEERMKALEYYMDHDNLDREDRFDRLRDLENSMRFLERQSTLDRDTLEDHEHRIWMWEQAARDLGGAPEEQAQASQTATVPAATGELQALQTDWQQAARDRDSAMESELEQIAGELRALQTGLASLETRMESEKLTTEQITGELPALQTAGQLAARDLASANDRQASLETRVESLEKLMVHQITGELQLQTAIRQATLENRLESIEKLMKEQIAREQAEDGDWQQTEKAEDSEQAEGWAPVEFL